MLQSHTILELLMTYRYALLFPLACLEGPMVAILAGFFIHLGLLSLAPSYFLLILGDFFSDSFFYFISRLGNKFKTLVNYKPDSKLHLNLKRIKTLWQTHTAKTMFFSKLAYGFSVPLLISAGLSKLPYKKFASYAILVSIIQYGVFLGVGYYFGRSYELASHYIKSAGIIIAGIGVLFVILYILIRKYAREEIINEENEI